MVRDGHLGGFITGGDPATWCPHLWTWVVRELAIQSVLDVGCGEAHSTKFFNQLGCDAVGVEGSRQAIESSAAPGRVVQHDFANGAFRAERGYDLVWSCEFLEHVEAKYVPNILGTFAQAARAILITHAFPGQEDGYHHVNCRSSRYWIQNIEQLGFRCDVALSRQARSLALQDYPGVNHFARSGLLFVREPAGATGSVALPSPGTGALGAYFGAWQRAARINYGFRLSSEFRQRRRERRTARRLARRSGLTRAA